MRFVFATEEVGFKAPYLPHLQITLTTLAEEPRLFAHWTTSSPKTTRRN